MAQLLICVVDEQSELANSKCHIKIILATPEDLFPQAKTLPSHSNVRSQLGFTLGDQKCNPATPFYNASIRADSSSVPLLKMLHRASAMSPGFADACILGSIWLRQRRFGSSTSQGGFGQFEWACMLATLLLGDGKETPRISGSAPSSRLFKAMINFIADRDLLSDWWDAGALASNVESTNVPIFMDADSGINLLFKTSSWSYKLIRHEARQSLSALNKEGTMPFEELFILRVSEPIHRYDSIFDVPFLGSPQSRSDIPSGASAGQSILQDYCARFHGVMTTALTDRVSLMSIEAPLSLPWSVALRLAPTPISSITFGVKHNTQQWFRNIDHGPPVDEKEAASTFRSFWGEKAELRRFKDGRILECVSWSNSGEASILEQIVRYVSRRHLGVSVADKAVKISQYLFQQLGAGNMESPMSIAPFMPLMSALESLETQIRSLEGLPLQIRQISGHSPLLRYAAAPSFELHDMLQPVDVYIQFEGSARWPNNFAAIQRTKIAFLLKLSELLKDANPQQQCRVGLENDGSRTLSLSFLDLQHPSGYLFRLRIHNERELSILRNFMKDKTFELGRREDLALGLSTYRRLFVQGPLFTQAIRTLCTRFPLLSPCMRLLKIWRDSHLLSSHINDELCELLVVHIFVHPYPWSTPGSITSGFFRALHFISKWNWRVEPLIVDFNGNMTKEDYQSILTRFEAWKKIDPGMNRMVMFAASNMDLDGLTWTEMGPSRVSAARFTELAKAACSVIKAEGVDINTPRLFASSTTMFDFLLNIRVQFTRSKTLHKKKSNFKNMALEGSTKPVSAPPLKPFVDELRSLYGQDVVFFYNEQKMDVLAGLWNPQVEEARAWKVNLDYSSAPDTPTSGGVEGPLVGLNKASTLNDIARLGGDLLQSVEIH